MPEHSVTSYREFLAHKVRRADPIGDAPTDLHPILKGWQAEIVTWACQVGRAAIWADTGLGKTLMQLEWARWMGIYTGGGKALVIAPLAVCHQTCREALKLDLTATYVRSGEGLGTGIWVTNYEMIDAFNPDDFSAVVLDEASILKQSDGKTRTRLIEWAQSVPYRLTCTATPAPNDPEELTNQAEFLGRMSRVNMLAAYFVHDADGWRVKGHAWRPMLQWMATWAVALRKPSDIGGIDDGYNLPGLDIEPIIVDSDITSDDGLFATLGGVQGRSAVRRQTLDARVHATADLIRAEPDVPWLIWCGLNDEAQAIAKLTGAVNVHGSLPPEEKADDLLAFGDGTIQRMVTKPAIASQGLNYQRCSHMAFVGLNDSYESYYQAIRRCYRYGQQNVVHAYIVLSDLESQIATNVQRKEREASRVTSGLVREMRRARGLEKEAS